MPQIFHPSTNTISRVSIAGAIVLVLLVGAVGGSLVESTYLTDVNTPQEQPVPFSHAHHVGGLGIDCRYCHMTVETSSFAGIPATEVCMNCHRQISSEAPMLVPVRASYRTRHPLHLIRSHVLPRFAYYAPL